MFKPYPEQLAAVWREVADALGVLVVDEMPDAGEQLPLFPLEAAVVAEPLAHAVTIEVVHLPAGNPLRATCLCGWASPIVAARPHAADAGAKHLRALDAVTR